MDYDIDRDDLDAYTDAQLDRPEAKAAEAAWLAARDAREARPVAETVGYAVELHAFGEAGAEIRTVEIPTAVLTKARGLATDAILLGAIWYWGQNDFQPRPMRSLCAGDIIHLGDRRFLIKLVGFLEVPALWATPTVPHGDHRIACIETLANLTWAGHEEIR